MLIYTPNITNRIRYIFQTIFVDVWNTSYELTDDLIRFQNHDGPKLNYSMRILQEELFVECHDLLGEKGISDQEIHITKWEGLPVFFQTSSYSSLPFDVFAASFYLLSRYEEYLPHIRDNHERFMAKESLAFQHGFLQKPLVNLWLQKLLFLIQQAHPDFRPQGSEFKFISTIDIDNAYCYLEKGLARTIGAFARSLWKGEKEEVKERWEVLRKKHSDPYDTFELQLALQEKYDLEVVYFVLLADYGLNDKNIPFQSRKFQLLIKHLSDHAQVGIHPSFGSNDDDAKLKEEWKRLKNIIKREVTISRQHFLKLSFPTTYRNLIDLGVQHDYTMGYAAYPGFRASICHPFYFYDLELEQSTSLRVHPFIVMDATFNYYLDFTPEQALSLTEELMQEVKKVNGTFVTLWHNETWSEHGAWKGWSQLYEEIVKLTKS